MREERAEADGRPTASGRRCGASSYHNPTAVRGDAPMDGDARPLGARRLSNLMALRRRRRGAARPSGRPVWKSKFYGAFVLNRRDVLHAIDATRRSSLHGVEIFDLPHSVRRIKCDVAGNHHRYAQETGRSSRAR